MFSSATLALLSHWSFRDLDKLHTASSGRTNRTLLMVLLVVKVDAIFYRELITIVPSVVASVST